MSIILHWIYIGITIVLAGLVLAELATERRWHHQLAYALILLPLVLRILHIK
jgi:bacteriorhodopsin